jgi:hypothetical protein
VNNIVSPIRCTNCSSDLKTYNVFDKATGEYVRTDKFSPGMMQKDLIYDEIPEPKCPLKLVPDGDYVVIYENEAGCREPILRRKRDNTVRMPTSKEGSLILGTNWSDYKILGKATIEWFEEEDQS